ncbi:putative na(+) h(+) antiporter 2 [Phaeomoniella chlamydospora]|uniref:Putative na(+) h(+) antiporter 2 n=1 Tax=Phaeomoniella chlamydospora TaxID=158046 RepID=A0A0G2ETX5_PHACM|nr:putative na(+) h(+) antiporter 2 [Phaeomoniella chlamydospora]
MWSQIEATPSHRTYLLLSAFLLTYALFSRFIRNRLHLSEPPLALLFGILLGPRVLGVLDPISWGLQDNVVQELTRVILGIQCFAIGIELPRYYLNGHWKSVAIMLGPVMAFGWLVAALFAHLLFRVSWPTSLVIAACLTPTDPVLAASVLSNSKFSTRVPRRIKHMLSAESASNDGVSFPFLYVGISILTNASAGESIKEWVLITILWQCAFGIFLGFVLGQGANYALRFSEARNYIGRPSFLVFYILLATLSVGLGSTLGSDDFLIAFFAGVGFARDGYYAEKTKEVYINDVVDLLLNSSVFVYFGSIIPWEQMTFEISQGMQTVTSSLVSQSSPSDTPGFENPTHSNARINPPLLFAFLVLLLLLRRIPMLMALHQMHLIPAVYTFYESLFAGHFGPMGLGALFLAIEARAQLEHDSSLPYPSPPDYHPPYTHRQIATIIIWPIVSFVVMGSTFVHGLSVAAISIGVSLRRKPEDRAPLLGTETERLGGMVHSDEEGDIGGEADDGGGGATERIRWVRADAGGYPGHPSQ